jgi:hypothetical protein
VLSYPASFVVIIKARIRTEMWKEGGKKELETGEKYEKLKDGR